MEQSYVYLFFVFLALFVLSEALDFIPDRYLQAGSISGAIVTALRQILRRAMARITTPQPEMP